MERMKSDRIVKRVYIEECAGIGVNGRLCEWECMG